MFMLFKISRTEDQTAHLFSDYHSNTNIYISYYLKGPEFVRKHILNKHGDKIEEVKKEVAFFNNFLMDAKRPALPEMKLPPLPGPSPGTGSLLILSNPVGTERVVAVHWWIHALLHWYVNHDMML